MAVTPPLYLCEQAIVQREGTHFIVVDRSNGALVHERIYTPAAALSLADQLVRAVTSPPPENVTPLPARPRRPR